MPYTIEIAAEHPTLAVDSNRLVLAVERILLDAGIRDAEISVACVTNERMHALNRQYLQHDYPTDVLSFVLERDTAAASLSGEIIVSADYAAAEAARYDWTTNDELLLYVIHGCLHLVGYDDVAPADRAAMRSAETKYLAQFGLKHRYEEPS